jgi:hypothetical protein
MGILVSTLALLGASTILAEPPAPQARPGHGIVVHIPPEPEPCARGCINPIEAVTYASYLGEKAGVAGDFELTVRAIGSQNGTLFLNSEPDYRDRNCLTVALPERLLVRLFQTSDRAAIERRLLGKRIVVSGIARQVRIDLTEGGRPTGKYYYQVHIRVNEPRQMRVLPRA